MKVKAKILGYKEIMPGIMEVGVENPDDPELVFIFEVPTEVARDAIEKGYAVLEATDPSYPTASELN